MLRRLLLDEADVARLRMLQFFSYCDAVFDHRSPVLCGRNDMFWPLQEASAEEAHLAICAVCKAECRSAP